MGLREYSTWPHGVLSDKLGGGQKHFDTLGVALAVVVSEQEV
jgi:hypothetical protein